MLLSQIVYGICNVVSLKQQHFHLGENLVQTTCSLVETESAFCKHGSVMETWTVKMALMKKTVVRSNHFLSNRSLYIPAELVIMMCTMCRAVFHGHDLQTLSTNLVHI